MIKTPYEQDIYGGLPPIPSMAKVEKIDSSHFETFFQLKEEEPSIFSDICEADFLINIHPSEHARILGRHCGGLDLHIWFL